MKIKTKAQLARQDDCSFFFTLSLSTLRRNTDCVHALARKGKSDQVKLFSMQCEHADKMIEMIVFMCGDI